MVDHRVDHSALQGGLWFTTGWVTVQVDADARNTTQSFDFSSQLLNSSECLGIHTLAYSAVNDHLYMECVGGGGALEWDVKSKRLVKQWDKVFGVIYSSHDTDSQYVVASHNNGNEVTVFRPQGMVTRSTRSCSTAMSSTITYSTITCSTNINVNIGICSDEISDVETGVRKLREKQLVGNKSAL